MRDGGRSVASFFGWHPCKCIARSALAAVALSRHPFASIGVTAVALRAGSVLAPRATADIRNDAAQMRPTAAITNGLFALLGFQLYDSGTKLFAIARLVQDEGPKRVAGGHCYILMAVHGE